jgi:hypothetical protein
MASFALFNDVVSFSYCIASVVDEWMRMEHWWNDTDRGRLKYWEKYLSNCMLYLLTYLLTYLLHGAESFLRS